VNKAARMVGLYRSVEAALVKSKGRGDGAVVVEFVAFDRVVGLGLDEGRDVRDDIPVAHVAF